MHTLLGSAEPTQLHQSEPAYVSYVTVLIDSVKVLDKWEIDNASIVDGFWATMFKVTGGSGCWCVLMTV